MKQPKDKRKFGLEIKLELYCHVRMKNNGENSQFFRRRKEYSVILATPFETINLEGKFNVAPSPVISVDDIPDDRYIGETLIIKGQNMPVKADWESINVHLGMYKQFLLQKIIR